MLKSELAKKVVNAKINIEKLELKKKQNQEQLQKAIEANDEHARRNFVGILNLIALQENIYIENYNKALIEYFEYSESESGRDYASEVNNALAKFKEMRGIING